MKKWLSLLVMTCVLFGAAYYAVATESGQKLKSRTEKSRALLSQIDALLAKEPNNSDLLGKRALIVEELASVGESASAAVLAIGTDESKLRLQAEMKARSVDPAYYDMLLERLNSGSSLSATESAELLASGRVKGENDPAYQKLLAKSDRQAYLNTLNDRMRAGVQLTPDEKGELQESGILESRENQDGLDDEGGPSPTFGYRWVDNLSGDTASFVWEELDTTAGATSITAINGSDDANAQITWGWNFNFFGVNYTSGFVTTNGHFDFVTGSSDYSNDCRRSTDLPSGPAIFPFWDDLNATTGGPNVADRGRVVWQNFGDHVTITWDSMGTCCTNDEDLLDFQAQIWSDGKIKFQYRQIQKNNILSSNNNGASATIGIQQSNSAGGLDSLIYHCQDGFSVLDTAYTNALDGRAIWFYQLFLNNDFSTYAVAQPSPLRVEPGSVFNVVGSFRNVGNVQQSCPVNYQFNGGPVVTENTASLPLNGTEDHDFAGTETAPVTIGDYELLVYSSLINDEDRANDTLRVTVQVRDCYDESQTDAFSVAGTTCGFGNDWNQTCAGGADESEDYIYRWTTTSNGSWNVQLTAGTEVTRGLIVATSCGPTNVNCVAFLNSFQDTLTLSCLPLAAGTYYIMVDRSSNCDAFNLEVTPCTTIGRCCYDGGVSCTDNGAFDCQQLGGNWDPSTTCAASPCPVLLEGGETCANAPTIPVPSTTRGTTVGGVDDDPGFECALGSDDSYFGGNTAPDDWYLIVGTGNDITVSLCNPYTTYDTQILVTCTADCQNFTCVAGNDDVFSTICSVNGASSIATFCSELGREYYVVVDGWGGGNGQFELAVTEGTACVNFVNCAPEGRCCYLDNGTATCADLLAIDCSNLNGQWEGSVTCASDPCPTGRCCYLDNGVGACTDITELECNELGGNWDGSLTCATDPCPTGRCCYLDNGIPSCNDFTELECGELGGMWDESLTCATDPCEVGRCCYMDGENPVCAENTLLECRGLQGLWEEGLTCVDYTCPIVVVGGETCLDAVPLEMPVSLRSFTSGGIDDDPGTSCNLGSTDPYEGTNTAPDKWYVVAGTGNTMTVSLCADYTSYDTQIGVFCSEDCIDFICVAGNDDANCTFSGVHSIATFCTQVGSSYYIVVDGWAAGNGVFELSITDDGVPCANPVACPITVIPCDPIINLAAGLVSAAQQAEHLQLHFTAPQDADYKVWYSTNPNNDGNPDDGSDGDFVLENTILGVTNGQVVVYDAPTGFGAYRYYVITADCGN